MINWILQRMQYKASLKDRINFCRILLFELLYFPILVVIEELKKGLSFIPFKRKELIRAPVNSLEALVCIHEWAGYEPKRIKKIRKDIKEFECGLNYQLFRYQNYFGKYNIYITLTISERVKYNFQLPKDVNFIDVSNDGYDFAGYAEFYRRKIEQDELNKYVIMTNTSVEKSIEPFLDDFISVFENDESIGLLGVSYNTKIYQTIIRNNFNPHIGGFFIMTTSDILRQIVKKNRNKFPGDGITHKLLLIRKGEIRMSKLVLKLGYKIAFVLNDGKLHTFGKRGMFDNGYASWSLPHGDYRLHCETPNKITPLNRVSCTIV
jgi:hypothetical protein